MKLDICGLLYLHIFYYVSHSVSDHMYAQPVEMNTSLGAILTLEDLKSQRRTFMSNICPEL